MATGNYFKSDLYSIYNIIQTSMIVYPKEMIIATLRDFFSKDSYYRYISDSWGFPNTADNTGLPIDTGINDDLCTRVFIGENYRYNVAFYPAILVKNQGSKSTPLSLNRERGAVKYSTMQYEDGYGNKTEIRTPESFVTAGIWEGSINIDILTRSLRSRDDLLELIGMCFTDLYFESLQYAGIVVKPPSIGSPSESEDRNDKLFRQSITLDVRTQWERNVPVKNIIDVINFSMEFRKYF